MPKLPVLLLLSAAALLSACGGRGGGGVFAGRSGPDEFAVQRQQPLVIPPDFNLVPPRPGAPRPQEADSSTQALQALFGGQRQGSAGEQALLGAAGAQPPAGIRSETGADRATQVVDKGAATRDILNAPASSTPQASAGTGTGTGTGSGSAAATGSAQGSPATPSSGATPPPR